MRTDLNHLLKLTLISLVCTCLFDRCITKAFYLRQPLSTGQGNSMGFSQSEVIDDSYEDTTIV